MGKTVNGKVEELFAHWDEAMIWSCLQGHMGTVTCDDEKEPTSAMADVGDICFFTGKPNVNLLKKISGNKLLVPRDDGWAALMEEFFGTSANKIFRYAIKKESDVFDTEKLTRYVEQLEEGFLLRMIDEEIYHLAVSEEWSVDLCSQFKDYADYQKRGLGVAVLHDGKLVAGASPYAVYNGGIEIEIDTKPEYRRKGLATICGAKLILECLKRDLYPSWDAHDLRSVALAEKLGYHMDHPYVTYELF